MPLNRKIFNIELYEDIQQYHNISITCMKLRGAFNKFPDFS